MISDIFAKPTVIAGRVHNDGVWRGNGYSFCKGIVGRDSAVFYSWARRVLLK